MKTSVRRIGQRLNHLEVLPIALAGAGLLLYWLVTARPLWVDEEMILLNARDRTFAHFSDPLWLNQSAPLGWLTLERFLLLSLGRSEVALRLLTVLTAIGTLGAAVWIGARWMTAVGAAALVALFAFGEWVVFFSLELKHYSSDIFWALLLPALGAWVVEDDPSNQGMRRAGIWWLACAVGEWFGNGALFVTPPVAVILTVHFWRRRGLRAAARVAFLGLVWLVSFALYYRLVLHQTLSNPYLQEYWRFAFPPTADGAIAVFRWLGHQLAPFATKPGGSGFPFMFWTAFIIGIAFATATRRAIGPMFASIPVWAVALAVLHIVPTFERLAVWVVPALYVGVALSGDAGVWLVSLARSRSLGPQALPRLAYSPTIVRIAGVIVGLLTLSVCANVVARGALAIAHKPYSNYGLDDRRSIRWLLSTHVPGDAIVTTHFGLAALWWYGGVNVSTPESSGQLADGSPIFEVTHLADAAQCEARRDGGMTALAGRRRVDVYAGFRMNVEPEGFDEVVFGELERRGKMVAYKQFAEESRVAIFEMGEGFTTQGASPPDLPRGQLTSGCLTVAPARRW